MIDNEMNTGSAAEKSARIEAKILLGWAAAALGLSIALAFLPRQSAGSFLSLAIYLVIVILVLQTRNKYRDPLPSIGSQRAWFFANLSWLPLIIAQIMQLWWLWLIAGVVAGALLVMAARAVTKKPDYSDWEAD